MIAKTVQPFNPIDSTVYSSVWRGDLPGEANSTVGLIGKFAVNTGNPAGVLPTCNIYSPGEINSTNDPYFEPFDRVIKKASIHVTASASSTAPVVGTKVRIDLYKINYDSIELIESFYFPVDFTKVGTSNNLNFNGMQTSTIECNTEITKSEYGVVFVNVQGADNINAVKGLVTNFYLS